MSETCNCATFRSAAHCPVHTQADYEAAERVRARPGRHYEEAAGHAAIHFPETDMGAWGCIICWKWGWGLGDDPASVPCIPRDRPADWPLVYP